MVGLKAKAKYCFTGFLQAFVNKANFLDWNFLVLPLPSPNRVMPTFFIK